MLSEATRLEIVQRHQQGMARRAIAEELGISRHSVARVLQRVQAQRDGQTSPKPRRRVGIVDAYEPLLKELLERYPNLTTQRALEELRARGYPGGYTALRQRMQLLRPKRVQAVQRFETGPGMHYV